MPRRDGSLYDIYVTGRDAANRSRIGVVTIDMDEPTQVIDIAAEPVLSLGELGMFDENGTSYPCLVQDGERLWLYYTGWMPTVLTPFQNHLGLAMRHDDRFRRVSRAPILERTDDDPLSIGSTYVLKESGRWRMWYTSFLGWGKSPEEPKHTYVIKYAESTDGLKWSRFNHVCIDPHDPGEYAIARPSVLYHEDRYHMWYCYRGEQYRIGYAISEDGIHWTRQDELAGITVSSDGWDSESVEYPHVFWHRDELFMLYCGNHYGKAGLGIARLSS